MILINVAYFINLSIFTDTQYTNITNITDLVMSHPIVISVDKMYHSLPGIISGGMAQCTPAISKLSRVRFSVFPLYRLHSW